MAVTVFKFSREVKLMPKTIQKINYKNFNSTEFLNEIIKSTKDGKYGQVLQSNSPDEAAAIFSGAFGSILNKHVPL